MHPFALNDEALDQVNGAGLRFPGIIYENPLTPIAPLPIKPIAETTLAIGEEGGWTPPLEV